MASLPQNYIKTTTLLSDSHTQNGVSSLRVAFVYHKKQRLQVFFYDTVLTFNRQPSSVMILYLPFKPV